MVEAVFDTLSFAKRMEQAGFTRMQAEALAEEQARLIDDRLATKADIAGVNANIEALRLSTKADIEALRLATKADIAGVKADTEALRLSTKADTEALRLSTKADTEALRLSTKTDLELLRRDMVIKLGGMFIAGTAVVSAIVTLLSRFPLHP